MKLTRFLLCIVVASAAFLPATTSAVTNAWTGNAADKLWSTVGNWSGGAPSATSDVIFGDADASGASGSGGTANSIVNANFNINTMLFTNLITIGHHNVQINPSQRLSVTGVVGGITLYVNSLSTNSSDQVYGTVTGGGTLAVSNTVGNINVRLGSGYADDHMATLDLSGLDYFEASVSRILVAGDGGSSSSPVLNRPGGTFFLAKTNRITCNSAASGFLIAYASGNSANGLLLLGQTNAIFTDVGFTVGGQKSIGTMRFNAAFLNPSVTFRNLAGTGRQNVWGIADGSTTSAQGTAALGTNDLTGGTVDALVNTIYVARGQNGNGTGFSRGELTFDRGTIDVNTLEVGYQNASGTCSGIGTVNVNGTGSLVVNTSLRLGRFAGGAPTTMPSGTLNVNGGMVVVKGDVVDGGGTSSITVNSGTLKLSGKMGYPTNAIDTLNLSGCTLELDLGAGGNPTNASVVAGTLTLGASVVTLNIKAGGLTGGSIPIIRYTSLSGSMPTLGTLPLRVSGYLTNNTGNSTIELVVTGFGSPRWSGAVNDLWNINTTTNWMQLGSGTPTTYLEPTVPGDAVLFDDAATGTTTVNLTATLSPHSVTVSNVIQPYVFSGSGRLSGSCAVIKRGGGTLTFSNTGSNDFTGGLTVEGGKLQIAGSADRLPINAAITLLDVAGVELDLNNLNQTVGWLSGGGAAGGNVSLGSGTLSISGGGGNYAGTISGTGMLVKNGAGAQVMNGANLYTGGTLVSAGTLTVVNELGSGTGAGPVTVDTNGTLQIGNGGAAGSVAALVITNYGIIQINCTNDFVLTNGVVGSGGITKDATNALLLMTANTFGGELRINAGPLRPTHPDALGDTNGATRIQGDTTGASARMELTGGLTFFEPLIVGCKQASSGRAPSIVNVSGTNTLAGPMTLVTGGSQWVFEARDGKLIISGPATNTTTSNVRPIWLFGAGIGEWSSSIGNSSVGLGTSVKKDDTGTWILSGANTYTGDTLVSNGTLLVNGSIPAGTVYVYGGTLGGTGSIGAPVVLTANAQIAPGAGIGTLTFSNALTLNGTNLMEISRSGAAVASDQVNVIAALTFGGELDVVLANGSDPLLPGNSIRLFNASSYTGVFTATNLPSLNNNSTWDTSRLGVDGTLLIVGAPVITQPPVSQTNYVGSNATFSVVAAGSPPVSYQWYLNTNTLLFGETSTNIMISNLTLENSGASYHVVASNTFGSVTSAMAYLTVFTPGAGSAPGNILISPATNTVLMSNGLVITPVTFSVVATGTEPLTYLWYVNSNFTAPVVVATNLTIASAVCNDNQNYYVVVVTNLYGTATSTVPAYLLVNDLNPPIFLTNVTVGTTTLFQGATYSLSVAMIANCNPAAYQWYLNGTNALVGKTGNQLVLTSVGFNSAGAYSVNVTNLNGGVTSYTNRLEVQYQLSNAVFTATGNSFGLQILGETGQVHTLWAKTNISQLTWQNVLSVTANVNGLLLLQDTAATNQSKFYRVGSEQAPAP